MSAITYSLSTVNMSVVNPVGKSFVLGLPDRQGNYCIGFAGMVWKIPSGAYKPGDRVRVMDFEEEQLQVERIIN